MGRWLLWPGAECPTASVTWDAPQPGLQASQASVANLPHWDCALPARSALRRLQKMGESGKQRHLSHLAVHSEESRPVGVSRQVHLQPQRQQLLRQEPSAIASSQTANPWGSLLCNSRQLVNIELGNRLRGQV